jgi:carboxylesterase type B
MYFLIQAVALYILAIVIFQSDSVSGQTLLAHLDYGSFEGAYSGEYNISYWMKIPFAAPPVGENRFRAPQPPLPVKTGIYNSTQTFNYCPQRTVSVSMKIRTCHSMLNSL